MRISILTGLALGAIVFSCKDPKTSTEKKQEMGQNILLQESTLEYSTFDFSKIKDEHFRPALLEGMKIQKKLVKEISDSEQEPTFENTIIALEKSNEVLSRVNKVFYALASAHTNDTIKKVQSELAPIFSSHYDEIMLDEKLFSRIKTLFDKKETLSLDAESLKLLEHYYNNFVSSGANLSKENKEILKEYNAKLATLQNDFNQKLLNATNSKSIIFDDVKELKGLSEEVLNNIKTDGGKYKISVHNTTQQPLLSSLKNAETRQKVFKNALNRNTEGEFSTQDIIKEIVTLRAKKAELLGFKSYADWTLQHTMAKNADNVRAFFKDLIPPTIQKAKKEAQDIQKLINDSGEKLVLSPADWNFYAEKVKKAKYDLDESEIKPYFELFSTLENGVFFMATKLYGITFKKRTDIPTYHPDVVVYELFEENGDKLGLFYGDFFARETKRGGAWMGNFVEQSKLFNKKPVIYNVCNYPKPAEGSPALLSFDDVITLYHEFGHALHGFFASQQYPSLSGTAVSRDFVELPSQIHENWATYPEVLKNYARHYKTGEVISEALIQKIKNAETFNSGYRFTEVVAASNIDLAWHTIKADSQIRDVAEFEKNALNSTGTFVEQVPPRYYSTYFAHIFGGGYAASYYAYQWSEMLDKDAFAWFIENGGLKRENGQIFRDKILSRGGTMDYEKMYIDFRGKAPSIEALVKSKGF